MYFKKWLILSEAKEDKELALQLVGNDKNVIDRINSIVPQGRKDTDQLTLLAAYYFSQHKNIEELLREFRAYLGYINNNRMQLYPVDHTTKKPEIPWDNYIHWTQVIHGLQGEDAYKSTTKQQVTDLDFQNEKPIETSTDGKIKVYKANSPQQCVILGKGKTFCISQPGNRMWQRYRDIQTSTFYFVYDEDPPHDRLGIVVVDKQPHKFELTDKVNRTGRTIDPITGQETTNPQSYIDYLKNKGIDISLFQNIEKSEAEIAEDEKLGRQNNDLSWFQGLSFDEKSKYIGRGHSLSDEQFDYLIASNLKSLLEQYVKIGMPLDKHQFDIIKNKKDLKDYYIHNRLIAIEQIDDLRRDEYNILNDVQKEKYFNLSENSTIEKMKNALYKAIIFKDFNFVKKIIEKGNKAFRSRINRYEIDTSIKTGNLDIVKYIVDVVTKNSNINLENDGTLASTAAIYNFPDIVKYLIDEKGVEIEPDTVSNACLNGNIDLVKYLIDEKGAEIRYFYLGSAARSGNFNLVKYLMDEKGVKIKIDDDDGWNDTFVIQAVVGNNIDIVKYFVDEKGLEIPKNIINYINGDNVDIVKYFVKKGAKPDMIDVDKKGKEGQINIIKYFVDELGIEIPVYSMYNSIRGGNHESVVKYFLEKGANTTSSMSLAAEYGYLNIVKLFDENYLFHYNDAIKKAAEFNHIDIVKHIVKVLETKAPAKIQKAIDIAVNGAIHKCNFEIIKYLIEQKNASINNCSILKPAENCNLQIVRYLIEKGIHIDPYAITLANRSRCHNVASYIYAKYTEQEAKKENKNN